MKRKINKRHLVSFIILVISIILLTISIIAIIKWKKDNKHTEKVTDKINEKVEIKESKEENVQIIEPIEEIPEENPYWDYIKMNLIDVDFNELKNDNPDTVGWLQVNGTNINYPFVQTTNNEYYLTHSFDKKYTDAGWVFLDYRNNLSELDRNTLIYAHSRLDKSMFGTLRKVLTNGWLNDKNNYVIKLSTEYQNTLWQVFSVYHMPTNNDFIQTEFFDDEEFLEFANKMKNRSMHNFNTSVNASDYILTLSTCYSDTEKMIMHAKLIKVETR